MNDLSPKKDAEVAERQSRREPLVLPDAAGPAPHPCPLTLLHVPAAPAFRHRVWGSGLGRVAETPISGEFLVTPLPARETGSPAQPSGGQPFMPVARQAPPFPCETQGGAASPRPGASR